MPFSTTTYTYDATVNPSKQITLWTQDSNGQWKATCVGHGYAVGDWVMVQGTGGATQYNGLYQVVAVTADSFNIVIGGTPPGTVMVRKVTTREIVYQYDVDGRLSTVTDTDLSVTPNVVNSEYTYTYDNLDRVLTIDNNGTADMPRVIQTFTYDANGNQATLSTTVNGVADVGNTYSYDALGRLTQVVQSRGGVTVGRVNYDYDADGNRLSERRYSDAGGTQEVATTTYAYDSDERQTSITHKKGTTTLASYSFNYDALSRTTQQTDAEGTATFAYDANGQLLGRDNSSLTDESYVYDNNGNRTMAGWSKDTDNRQTSDGVYNYVYDAEGNVSSRTLIAGQTGVPYTEYTWDNRNRLTKVTFKTSVNGTETGTISYRYDVNNECISVIGTGSVTTNEREVREGGNLLLVTNASGGVTSRFFTSTNLNEVIAEDSGGTLKWALADQEGSVRDVADSSGSKIDHIVYDSYGKVLSQTNSANALRVGYTGQQRDDAAGLWYCHARYYDAGLGRFINQDPSGFGAGDDNLYRYVGNSPINGTDPTGMIQAAGTPMYGGASGGVSGGATQVDWSGYGGGTSVGSLVTSVTHPDLGLAAWSSGSSGLATYDASNLHPSSLFSSWTPLSSQTYTPVYSTFAPAIYTGQSFSSRLSNLGSDLASDARFAVQLGGALMHDAYDFVGQTATGYGESIVVVPAPAGLTQAPTSLPGAVGRNFGRAAAGVQGAFETWFGGGMAGGGGALTVTVAGSPVGVPATAVGLVIAGHGVAVDARVASLGAVPLTGNSATGTFFSQNAGGGNGNQAPRGGANPAVQAKASRGSTLHADKPGSLPGQLRQKYPATDFDFTKPGEVGQDVRVTGGVHPSQYRNSDWPAGVDHADFKPATASGERNFWQDQTNKWYEPTHQLRYDPQTGLLQ